jgi:hypothetical protein
VAIIDTIAVIAMSICHREFRVFFDESSTSLVTNPPLLLFFCYCLPLLFFRLYILTTRTSYNVPSCTNNSSATREMNSSVVADPQPRG